MLKQYEKVKERTLELEELRNILYLDKGKYPRYSNFKQKVLKVAHKEINESTDIHFEFEEIKLGRKVAKIKFIIKSEKTSHSTTNDCFEEVSITIENDKYTYENLYIEELKKIFKEDLNDNELEIILNVADNNIEKIKEKYEIAKVSKYDNLVGFLISAITKDFKSPINNNQPKSANRFHNFEQQDLNYTNEELEAKLRSR